MVADLPPLAGEVDRGGAARRWGRVAGAALVLAPIPFGVLPPQAGEELIAAVVRAAPWFRVCGAARLRPE